MIGMSAVIFIPDDTAKTGYPQPLMLQSVMGAPLLAWLANALFDSGVGRFFLVCHDRYVEVARACLPAEAEVMTTAACVPFHRGGRGAHHHRRHRPGRLSAAARPAGRRALPARLRRLP